MMDQIQGLHPTTEPFLTKYASKRTKSPEIIGYYSDFLSMWVVNINGKEAPLIDQKNTAVELITKTLSSRETDDEDFVFAMAELSTKTDTQAEQDDASMTALELATKTESQMEHDDTSVHSTGLFL